MNRGIQLALLTAGISGVSIFTNALFVSKTDPLVFALLRNTIVAVMFTILLFMRSKISEIISLTKRDWAALIAIGATGGGIAFALFFSGLSEIGAVNGNLIQKTLFIWVLFLAVPLLKERVRILHMLGYAVLFLGMFYFGGTVNIVPKTGTWLVLGATLLWSVEQIIAKITLKRVSPLIVSWGRILFGIPFLYWATLFMGKSQLLMTPNSYVLMPLVVSAFLLVAYMSAWYSALAKAPATLVSSVLVLAPVVTALLQWFVLHRPIVGGQMVSYIALAIGVSCIAIASKRYEH